MKITQNKYTMKTMMTMIGIFLLGMMSYAQPSEAQMIAKIKADDPSVTKVELFGQGIITKMINEKAEYYTYYRHSYRTTKPTEYTGISEVYSGSIQYVYAGGGYVFDQYLIGDVWYIGVPDPDKAEVEKLLKSDLKGFLETHHYNDIVGDVSEITFPADPEFHWHKLTSVSFKVNVTYTEKLNYTELEKAIHTYEVRLYSDAFKGPWTKFISSDQYENRKVLEVTKYTADEVRAMKTLWQIDAENSAGNAQAGLPSVTEPPVFQSDQQLFYFLHNIIMTKSNDEVKAYLYKLMSADCYAENSTVLLSQHTQEWFDKITNNQEAYKAAHCEYPTVKHSQAGMIEFYDRGLSRILRMTGKQEGGTWKIILISFYPAPKSEWATLSANNANCQSAPDLNVREVKKYKVGDKVVGIFSNGKFNSTVDKIDPYNSNRYYIKLDGDNSGKGYWMDEIYLEPSTGNSSEKSTSSSSASYKVGDDVYVATTSGKLKATIKEISGDKVFVNYKNPMYEDAWVAIGTISKEK